MNSIIDIDTPLRENAVNLLQSRLLGCFVLLLHLVACGEVEVGGPIQDSEPAPSSVHSGETPTYLTFAFEGRLSADGGMEIGMLGAEDVARGDGGERVVSVAQASYCEATTVADGEIGSNPDDTFEIYTVGEIREGADCLAGDSLPLVYTFLGLRCADITIRNFFEGTVQDVHAQIDQMVPSAGALGFAHPLGTGATPAPGLNNPLGLWRYGNLSGRDGEGDAPRERTVRWMFEDSAEAVYFQGRVMARVDETCGDGVDNDCNGRADEGCGTVPIGGACIEPRDCASGFCDASGLCGDSTCSNGLVDGNESGVDCGGGCAPCGLGAACFTHADCATDACNDGRCDAARWPFAGQLVISEVMINPAAVPDFAGEWFELVNTSDTDVSLVGCELSDDGIDLYTFVDDVVVGGRERIVLGREAAFEANGGVIVHHEYSGMTFADSVDELTLRCDGQTVDRIAWRSLDLAEGTSLQLDGDSTNAWSNNEIDNFCGSMMAFGDGDFGTPGLPNPGCVSPGACPEGFWDHDGWAGSACVAYTTCRDSEVERTPPTPTSDRVCEPDCEGNRDTGDTDEDGLCNNIDACLGVNTTGDSDSDGVCNDLDVCPLGDDSQDADGDGVPSACDCRDGTTLRGTGCVDGYIDISPGAYHICGVTQSGATRCFGDNTWGQRNVPAALPPAREVSAAVYHSCIRDADGGVRCWGLNTTGQVSVPADLPVSDEICIGWYHSCSRGTDGSVRCWGTDEFGGLSVPTDLERSVDITCNHYSTCSLGASGDVRCWGQNPDLDEGLETNVPVLLAPVVALSEDRGGGYHCGIYADGTRICWGYSGYGLFEDPSIPVSFDVAFGGNFMCAIDDAGVVDCWGGTTEFPYADAAVVELPFIDDAVSLAAGYYYACAIRTDGSAQCWGRDVVRRVSVGAPIIVGVPGE